MVAGSVAEFIEPTCPGAVLVPGGATVCGGRGDAVIRVDEREHHRRAALGLGAVDLSVVSGLFELPLGYTVRWDDLDQAACEKARSWPDGIVDHHQGGVRRRLVPPVHVDLVVVTGLSWIPGARAAAAFGGKGSGASDLRSVQR